jgi:glycosyltransferase involved in cell wall biosynthesis
VPTAIINNQPSSSVSPVNAVAHDFAFVAPRHADGSNWPWLSEIGPMRRHRFTPVYIENTFKRLPKATRPFIRWQYLRAMRAIQGCDLAFLFSTDIGVGMTRWPADWAGSGGAPPKRIYVGFTQDGDWPHRKVDQLSSALNRCDAVTVFSNDERDLYIERYRLNPRRVEFIPIHTDEPAGYGHYSDTPPLNHPYVLSLGSPNRRFMPIARACRAHDIPLVIITRPWHKNDSLDELAGLGATIITNADKNLSLTYLKHARFAAMCFETDTLPGAFTTLIHAMFMGTPSVVTNCLGMTDYIAPPPGENGLIVPHGDDAALGEAIARLWNDADLAERFAHAGLERAANLHSLEAAAVRFEALAERVLSDRD